MNVVCAIESGLQTRFFPLHVSRLCFIVIFLPFIRLFLQEASQIVFFFLVKFRRPKTENLRNSMFVCKCSEMFPTTNLLYGLHACSSVQKEMKSKESSTYASVCVRVNECAECAFTNAHCTVPK